MHNYVKLLIVVGGITAHWMFPNVLSFLRFAVLGFVRDAKNTSTDGREKRCLEYVKTHAVKGNATDVLFYIDKFGWTEDFLMNVGDAKGGILSNALEQKAPLNVLEVGAYVGYSATRIGSGLAPEGHLTSVEFSGANAAIARDMVEYAGLSDKVDIIVGTVTTALKNHMQKNGIRSFDFVFIDHEKSAYLSDLKYMLKENMIAKGGIIVGDNILFPGAPDYREFVNSDPRFRTTEHTSHVEYLPLPDIVTVSEFLGNH